MTGIPESFARRILELAIAEGRAAEMLECLFDGGSVTVDASSGRLCLMNVSQLAALEAVTETAIPELQWITPAEDMWQDDDIAAAGPATPHKAGVGRTEREPR